MSTPDRSPKLHFKSLAYEGLEPGPRLIVTGAVHGNETCGTRAIERLVAELDAGKLAIGRGSVTLVPITNPLAYAKRDRAGDRNLNRNLGPVDHPVDFEDRIANWLCPLLARHEALLDLHSTRGKTQPFAMLGPRDNTGPIEPFTQSAKERALAKHLGVTRLVEGWLSTYARGVARRLKEGRGSRLNTDPRYGIGTTEYMRSVGGYAVTLECGQHDDPASPEVGYRAIRNTLAFLGMTPSPALPQGGGSTPAPSPMGEGGKSPSPLGEGGDEGYVTPSPALPQGGGSTQNYQGGGSASFEGLRIHEVIDRDHEADRFAREWSSFDVLNKGDLIATRGDGTELRAPDDGWILFPDAKAQPGHEWFYLAEANPGIV